MGDLINLNKRKKTLERDKAATQAANNRAKFGRTKAQKSLDKESARRADSVLDHHRLENEETS